jgi:hypothetical protein
MSTSNKGQALADFILECPPGKSVKEEEFEDEPSAPCLDETRSKQEEVPELWWTLHVDGSVDNEGAKE